MTVYSDKKGVKGGRVFELCLSSPSPSKKFLTHSDTLFVQNRQKSVHHPGLMVSTNTLQMVLRPGDQGGAMAALLHCILYRDHCRGYGGHPPIQCIQ